MFRDAVARGTELGRIIQRYKIEKGEYVPDEVVVRRGEGAHMRAGLRRTVFCWTAFRARFRRPKRWTRMLAEQGRKLDGVLDFEAPIEEIVGRFSGRRVCPFDGSTYHLVDSAAAAGRAVRYLPSQLVRAPDDEPDVVQRRLEVYTEKTAPLSEYYRQRGLLHTIDATAEPETVFGAGDRSTLERMLTDTDRDRDDCMIQLKNRARK